MNDRIQRELDGIIQKINKNMRLYRDKTPCVTPSLKYSERLSADGDWTGSFWLGMVALAYAVTGDERYFDYIDHFYDFYENRLKTGYKDHDLGFLYQLYAVNAYRVTNQTRYLDMAVEAARSLVCRYNPRGGFIRAWDRLINANCAGKIIIDCMLNLPLLFSVYQITGNAYYKEVAYHHALATLHNIRPDGSTYHTYNFDYVTGKPLYGENEGGYADESCWSRGQAWGIYGFYLAWFHTGEQQFLDASVRLADYFMTHLDADAMPKWDFKLDEQAPSPDAIDTSAAAIAACGMYALARQVPEKQTAYTDCADRMLHTLMEVHSVVFEPDAEVLLKNCYCGGFSADGQREVRQWSAIFGDFFYMEALTKKLGLEIYPWNLN